MRKFTVGICMVILAGALTACGAGTQESSPAESIETAGVVGGGKIAEYLSEEEKSNAVLDALMSESAASPVAAAEPAVVEEPIVAAEPTAPVLEEKLAELTGESAAAPESKTEEEAQKKQEELDAVNAKLDDLLSGRK